MASSTLNEKSKKYWMGSVQDLLDPKIIQKNIFDGASNCCEKNCILNHFSDKEGLFDLKACAHFVHKHRSEYASKNDIQREELIYKIYEKCLLGPSSIEDPDKLSRYRKFDNSHSLLHLILYCMHISQTQLQKTQS